MSISDPISLMFGGMEKLGPGDNAHTLHVPQLVQTHLMDMKDIPQAFHDIDLLWSEVAAYNIGFANALAVWAPALAPGGFAVVSELCWLTEPSSEEVRKFFGTGYPDMRSVPDNMEIAERAGYKVLAAHTLPRATWVEGSSN